MMNQRFIGSAFAAAALLFSTGCYNPAPADGSFACSGDLGNLCPVGLLCSPAGLCVHSTVHDMGGGVLDLSGGDQSVVPEVRSCDDRVREGAFSNLTPLSAANTAADESHIMLDPSGSRLLFQRGNQLFSAPFAGGPKAISTPVALTLTSGPTTINGGSFTLDGKLWLSGTVGGSTGLYTGTANASGFDITGPRQPVGTGCAFSDPSFLSGDATSDLFASYALAGCAGSSYVVQGAADRNLGAFFSALSTSGWSSPTVTTSGLMLISSSTGTDHHLFVSLRSDPTYQFNSAARIPMAAIGEAIEDRQAVVSSDCSTIYFSSVRTGGAGGADLYAADVAAK